MPLLFRLFLYGLSFYLSLRSSRSSIRPVIAVVYDDNNGWSILNIGNGPALNVVVAQKPQNSNWFHPVRVHPLPSGGEFGLAWMVHDNAHGIGVHYEDFHEREYSSICSNDLTKVHQCNIFPHWSESEIGRHWWKNPTKPTASGEIKGEWKGE